jgi:hypothetical protein
MFALALVVLVLALALAYEGSRRSRQARPSNFPDRVAPLRSPSTGVQRWVDAGLITADQADAIATFEETRQPSRPEPVVAPAVEALAYLGGVLLSVGAGMLVARVWEDLGTAGHLAIVGAAASVVGVVGLLVGEAEPVAWRLRGFLWALSSGGIAAVAGLTAFEVLDASGEPVALAAAGIGGLSSLAYWQLRDRPLQHLVSFVGLAVSVGVTISWVGGERTGAAIGVALWSLGAVWAWQAWCDRLRPALVGFPLGVLLTLVASAPVGDQVEWLAPLLGLATAGGWVAFGTIRAEPMALAPGVAGVFVYLPWTIGYFFGASLGAPAIVMLSGAALLGVVTLFLRRGRGGTGPRGWAGHFRPVPP